MNLKTIHEAVFEQQITGRYVTVKHIESMLKKHAKNAQIDIVGNSVLGAPIYKIKIGSGSKKVLAWSQMHGNESTTTKAIFDFLSLLSNETVLANETNAFLNIYELHIIPILNPDGAAAYTRTNANDIDLNRDAQKLSQPESKVLATQFSSIEPELCLNLHDQRSIYGFDSGKPAIVSFLSPSADEKRTVTPSRSEAMQLIERMTNRLELVIPGAIGRYDDGFNANCVGDTFAMAGVPTILFEAGHAPDDYMREQTRSYIFYALLELFGFLKSVSLFNAIVYNEIPENRKNYCDIVLKNVSLGVAKNQNIAIQYVEELQEGEIIFKPSVYELDSKLIGYNEIDFKGAKIEFDLKNDIKEGVIFDKIYNSSIKTHISLRIS